MKFATLAYCLSGLSDRFVKNYGVEISLEDKIKKAAKIKNLSGLELVYPVEVNEKNSQFVKEELEKVDIELAAIGTSISNRAKWKWGALTSPDKKIRKDAINLIKKGMDLSEEFGCKKIFFFLGQDGFDYPFETEYLDCWKKLVDSIRECAQYRDDVKICLEYKPSEPRKHIFVSNVGKTILLIKEIDMKNVGVLLDFGHCLFGKENISESISLLSKYNLLFHLHVSDNYGMVDDDMIPGSVHFLEFLEALFWLKKVGYDGWYSTDIYPYREDPIKAIGQGIKFIQYMDSILDNIDKQIIDKNLRNKNAVGNLSLIQDYLFNKLELKR